MKKMTKNVRRKILQYLMGHSDISVTFNTYTHLKLEDAREEMNKLAKKKDEADTELQKLGIKKDQNPFLKHG